MQKLFFQIKQTIESYIEQEQTIILAVIPANADIATSEALQMAKKVDPHFRRTIGIEPRYTYFAVFTVLSRVIMIAIFSSQRLHQYSAIIISRGIRNS